MTSYTKKIITLLYVFLGSVQLFSQEKVILDVSIDGFLNDDGLAQIALFNNKESFLTESPYQACSTEIETKKAVCRFEVEKGSYAIVVIHDENSNNMLDRNLLDVPVEAYGFSRNIKLGLRAPTYEEVKFLVECPTAVNISVK